MEVIGKKIEHQDLRGSVRLFLKLFLEKSLAQQYSRTGLGAGRKKNKKSFRESPVFSFFQSKKFYFN